MSLPPRPWDRTNPANFFRFSPEARIAALEARLEKLEKFVARQCGPIEEGAVPQETEAKRRRSGPKPSLPLEGLVNRRNWLINTLEFLWPELRLESTRTRDKDVRTLVRRLLKYKNHRRYGGLTPWMQHVITYARELHEFVKSRDYRGDPRQIANALAGLPEYAVSTSLKLCRRYPSNMAIGERALRDYLRRNFPTVFPPLLNAKTAEDVQRIMNTCRTKDREFLWLRDHPEQVFLVLELGRPR